MTVYRCVTSRVSRTTVATHDRPYDGLSTPESVGSACTPEDRAGRRYRTRTTDVELYRRHLLSAAITQYPIRCEFYIIWIAGDEESEETNFSLSPLLRILVPPDRVINWAPESFPRIPAFVRPMSRKFARPAI